MLRSEYKDCEIFMDGKSEEEDFLLELLIGDDTADSFWELTTRREV